MQMSLHFLDHNARKLAEAHRTDDLKDAAQQAAQSLVNAAVKYNRKERTPLQPNTKLPELSEWTAVSRSNWRHMLEIGFALLFEYSWRKGESIEDVKKVLSWARSTTPYNMPELGLQRVPLIDANPYSNFAKDPIEVWRMKYADADNVKPDDWGSRDVPEWYNQALANLVSGRSANYSQLKTETDETEKS